MLHIQKFIQNHPTDWEELLSSEPFLLKIKHKDHRVLFAYRQGQSDYNEPIVREARGLILDDRDFSVVCMAFTKFFDCHSQFADEVDWKTVRVQEKLDGTLITLYYYEHEWYASTTGNIDAYDAELEAGYIENFGTLFRIAYYNADLDTSRLNTANCYMFELTSPVNRQVVKYEDFRITHIGTRNLHTLKELETDIGIRKPIEYPITSLPTAIKYANRKGFDGEGFVAVDANYNRIKIKSEEWLKWHYLINNNHMTVAKAIEIIRGDDYDEFVSNFPVYKEFLEDVSNALNQLEMDANRILSISNEFCVNSDNRKEFAQNWFALVLPNLGGDDVKSDKHKYWKSFKDVYFNSYNNFEYTAQEWVNSLWDSKLEELIKIVMEID